MSGTFKVDSGGKVEFQEEDGIDYAPVTVQLPGGERVPFLFTVKELSAKGSLDGFGGDFTVPSYRGSSFLDPKVVQFMQCRTYLPVGCRVLALVWFVLIFACQSTMKKVRRYAAACCVLLLRMLPIFFGAMQTGKTDVYCNVICQYHCMFPQRYAPVVFIPCLKDINILLL